MYVILVYDINQKRVGKALNNCASHSRYFSDELGALFF